MSVFLLIAENMVILRFLVLFHFLLGELFQTVIVGLEDRVILWMVFTHHACRIDIVRVLVIDLIFTLKNLKLIVLIILKAMVVHVIEDPGLLHWGPIRRIHLFFLLFGLFNRFLKVFVHLAAFRLFLHLKL